MARSRIQKTGENVEAFAADLKRLYYKAYKGRPDKIRQEDLLRQFFDVWRLSVPSGLTDSPHIRNLICNRSPNPNLNYLNYSGNDIQK
jgi:hypothetical protein